ncbi:MAG: ATP-dependent RecD-like DNA helicase [Clostridia bacterium]|nr:ATP-dependent RecD-like DNA helicase [Clostridia bacterium]
MINISGTVEKIIFQSPQTWYSVCDVCLDTGEGLTVVGVMPYISVGECISASGTFITSKEYGKQFKVEAYKKYLPKNKNSILRYLSSGAIKGIGAKIAKKIVDEYGEDAFDVIENHPDWLVSINGISRKKAYDISFDFKEKSDVRRICEESGGIISPDTSAKIYKKWGKNALGILRENPYALCDGDFGVSFKFADEIAFSYGISPSDKGRVKAAIKYVLGVYAARDGHTYVQKNKVVEAVSKLIGISQVEISPLFDEGELPKGISKITVKGEACLTLNELYFAEINIAKRLHLLNRKAISFENSNLDSMVARLEESEGIKYAHLQKRAIYESLKNGVTVLTGGPGTGKTTVIKALTRIFDNLGLSYALCAPTGRAAKRMSEQAGVDAKTVHRLLEVTVGAEYSDAPKFGKNATDLLSEDVIILDESSMIDVLLANALVVAIKPGARIIFIGDTDQLLSVGEGNVLNDIIASGCFSTVCLNEIFRQAENSGIVTNAHKINKGIYPDLGEKYDDFFFIPLSDEKIPEYIADLSGNRLPKRYGKDGREGVQVICPSKKGIAGVGSLNFTLQERLNPQNGKKAELKRGQTLTLRQGDKVMQTKNNYSAEWVEERAGTDFFGMGIYNGDIGVIKSIDDELTVSYGTKDVIYQKGELDELELAYAITVHKSQGSEYPIVIIPISPSCPYMLLTRNLIYTAITRAEKMVILVGDPETFYKMIDNNTRAERNTLLKDLLENEAK